MVNLWDLIAVHSTFESELEADAFANRILQKEREINEWEETHANPLQRGYRCFTKKQKEAEERKWKRFLRKRDKYRGKTRRQRGGVRPW